MPRNSSQPKVRQAAAYIRVSTEYQQYSVANQLDAIEKYAGQNNLVIAKKFIDSARSGLTLQWKTGPPPTSTGRNIRQRRVH